MILRPFKKIKENEERIRVLCKLDIPCSDRINE